MSTTATPPRVGRIIHYVVKDGQRPGETRAAIITRTFHQKNEDGTEHINWAVNLTVFPDQSNPSLYEELSASSSLYDESGKPGTWSYPPHDPQPVEEEAAKETDTANTANAANEAPKPDAKPKAPKK